jgi:hypothetical protein
MMQNLRKLMRLAPRDKLLLLGAFEIVLLARLGLTLFSYKLLQRCLPKRPLSGTAPPELLRRVSWGVGAAAKYVPGASCLTQALAAQYLLAWSGYASQIRIGVAIDPNGQFKAHAWLMNGNSIVIGGSPARLRRFEHLADLDMQSL